MLCFVQQSCHSVRYYVIALLAEQPCHNAVLAKRNMRN